MNKAELINYFNRVAAKRDTWKKRSWYYHRVLASFFSFSVPTGSSVLEIGCGTGDLLQQLKPSTGVGLDFSAEMLKIASKKYPQFTYVIDDIENLQLEDKFDYVIMQDLISHLGDVWQAFRCLRKVTKAETRIIITNYNHLWEPIIVLAEKCRLKIKQPAQNWLSIEDIENILYLSHYEVVKKGYFFLVPVYVPFISDMINKYVAKLPGLRKLCLATFVIAKEKEGAVKAQDYSCSVIIPCRNEVGNIEKAIATIPPLGRATEIIFVDGNSTDGTVEKIQEEIQRHKNISLIHQGGALGKADAVRQGFDAAHGEILIILDADLTVPAEDLPKFYLALSEHKGEFINGTRLVYPMEKRAMRTLNMLGNKVFSMIFTWILEQRIKDTLCGTKALFKKDYLRIKAGREYFGDFDPFGDFDLLFGAAKLNLKIVEIPVSYKERTYGTTKISRFRHGWLLLQMCLVAFRKFKLQ